MKGAWMILRRIVADSRSRGPFFMAVRGSSREEALMLSSATATATASFSTLILSDVGHRPLFNSIVAPAAAASPFSHLSFRFNHPRSFSSDASSGPSNIISIESEQQFNESLHKAQDESLPAMFYFTAAWCGPCRLLSPVISQLSEKYPHVTIYKIDIDKESLNAALPKTNVQAVPTIHFFQNGRKVSEMVGTDEKLLSSTMGNLYK